MFSYVRLCESVSLLLWAMETSKNSVVQSSVWKIETTQGDFLLTLVTDVSQNTTRVPFVCSADLCHFLSTNFDGVPEIAFREDGQPFLQIILGDPYYGTPEYKMIRVV